MELWTGCHTGDTNPADDVGLPYRGAGRGIAKGVGNCGEMHVEGGEWRAIGRMEWDVDIMVENDCETTSGVATYAVESAGEHSSYRSADWGGDVNAAIEGVATGSRENVRAEGGD